MGSCSSGSLSTPQALSTSSKPATAVSAASSVEWTLTSCPIAVSRDRSHRHDVAFAWRFDQLWPSRIASLQ